MYESVYLVLYCVLTNLVGKDVVYDGLDAHGDFVCTHIVWCLLDGL